MSDRSPPPSPLPHAGQHLRARVRQAFPAARIVSVLVALGCAVGSAESQTRRDLLSGGVSQIELAGMLVPREQWKPYPTIDDREAWARVPQGIRADFVREAEQYVGSGWKWLPATLMLEYVRSGDRRSYEIPLKYRRKKLATLVMAELFEDRGRFLDEIADGVWVISEETYWGTPAHLGAQKRGVGLPDATEPIIELYSAEVGALLSWTDYLLGDRLDRVSPLIRERIRHEVDRRVLTPGLTRDDFGWMGFGGQSVNNWNPWINSNWLAAALLLERDPQRRAAAVHKILRSVDVFINSYPDDGASDEGPGYWGHAGASLFDNLELLRSATGGRIDLYDHPLVKNMAQYIYRAYISGEYFVNTGDASARLQPEAELVYRFGRSVGDPAMQGFGAFLAARRGPFAAQHVSDHGTPGRLVPALLAAREIAATPPAEPLLGEVWLPDLQLMAARQTPGSDRGLYLSALGGHNAQSHNHNDVGNFIVYADGRPVLIDVGVEAYTAKTFSPRRYEIWTMNSDHHNLPTINGVQQGAGREFQAREVEFSSDGDRVRFSLDIARAYPAEARVESFDRTLTLDRSSRQVELHDAYVLKERKEPLRLNLMTPLRVDVSRPGEVRLSGPGDGESYVIAYDPAKLGASVEEIAVSDARLRPVWGDRVARIVLTSRSAALRDDYRLSIRPAGGQPTD